MTHILQIFRHIVTGIFVVCNAVITSAAVWNLNLVQTAGIQLSDVRNIDSYLIFVGASSLVIIFPVIFIELLGHHSVLGRVWVECLRVGVCLILELAGAIGLTAVSHPQLCTSSFPGDVSDISSSTLCVSTEVLQAFTWICALFLSFYFSLLVTSTMLQRRADHTIWHCSMRMFPWSEALRPYKNKPPASTERGFREIGRPKLPPIVTVPSKVHAPVPRRVAENRERIYSYQSGPNLENNFEHYLPQEGNALELNLEPQAPPPGAMKMDPVSLYPQYLRSTAFAPLRRVPVQGQTVQIPDSSDPSPLGDWPRLDAPLRTKRTTSRSTLAYQQHKASRSRDDREVGQSSRQRPSGPRNRAGSGDSTVRVAERTQVGHPSVA